MVYLLRDKYKPIYTSELEYDYPEISEALNNLNYFVISGPKSSGKTTILKLYLSINNFDYLYICENSSKITLDYIIDLFRFKSNS
jgi:predicted AAA+ superfamily ATPase